MSKVSNTAVAETNRRLQAATSQAKEQTRNKGELSTQLKDAVSALETLRSNAMANADRGERLLMEEMNR